jgi:hypothetical protein
MMEIVINAMQISERMTRVVLPFLRFWFMVGFLHPYRLGERISECSSF